jgi:hypothetical protein
MNESEFLYTLNCLIDDLEQLKRAVKELEEIVNERNLRNGPR